MMIRAAFVAAALAIAGSSPAWAQAQFTTPNGSFVPGVVAMCLDANGHAVATNQSSACPGGGGGGGGLSVPYGGAIGANGTPVGLKDPATGFLQPFQGDTTNGVWANLKTAADGAIVTLGAKADPAWVSGDGTVIGLLKNMAIGIGGAIPDCGATPCTNKIGVVGVNTWGGTAVVNGGLAGSLSVGGTVATNVAITDNPLNIGAQAVSAENTAVTATRKAQLVTDLVGRLIVFPMANKENLISGVNAAAMTGTSSTQIIGAVASTKLYITSVSCENSHATVGTLVNVQDGSGGAVLATLACGPAFGGDEKNGGGIPLFSTTAGNGLFAVDATTGANVFVNASGFKGT